jgi:glycosyltransferase involved in cell wall biosynthesis
LYVRPDRGGVRVYSDLMLGPLTQVEGLDVESVLVKERTPWGIVRGVGLGLRLARSRHDALYVELGAHGTRAAWAVLVAGALGKKYVLTVHDGAIVVETMFPFIVLRSLPKPICSVANRLSRLADAMFKRALVNRVVGRASSVFSLATDQVVSGRRTRHLPPPSYVRCQHTYVPPATPVVGFVGFWGGAKGIETLTRALTHLHEDGFTCRAVIGGSTGDVEDVYSRAIRRSAAESGVNVEFPGFIPDDRLEPFVSGLSALVIPYLREHPASSSGVAVWGLSLGVPVVASDTPALRRQLGEAAIYFEPGNATELAAALRCVLSDPEAATERARNGQEEFFRRHSDRAVSRLLAEYLADGIARQPEV